MAVKEKLKKIVQTGCFINGGINTFWTKAPILYVLDEKQIKVFK